VREREIMRQRVRERRETQRDGEEREKEGVDKS